MQLRANPSPVDETVFQERFHPEIVVFVAPAASGKSSLAASFIGHQRINQDSLKTVDKCIAVATLALSAGKSVVIDSTNLTPDIRRHWVELAGKMNVQVNFEACKRLPLFANLTVYNVRRELL